MQQRILEGNAASIGPYIKDFIEKNAIPPFGITSFTTTAKIADILYIQKILSHKSSHPLAFIFHSDITHEAQNALLKTLEESPEDVYFLFCVSQASQLLPTICSRAKIIPLGFTPTERDDALDGLIRSICESASYERLVFVEKLLEQYEKDKNYESLLQAFHRSLIDNPSHRMYLYRILISLQFQYQLVRSNNVSFKMTLDMAFVSA